jgi:hypothetical protein
MSDPANTSREVVSSKPWTDPSYREDFDQAVSRLDDKLKTVTESFEASEMLSESDFTILINTRD